MKIGLLGGTFDPIHKGHLYIAKEVLKKLSLDKVIFVPANVPPNKENALFSPANIRFEMVKKSISPYSQFEISDEEIKRQGVSYTIDTVRNFKEKFKAKLFLIMGMDQLLAFHAWKDYELISNYANLVVINRQGFPQKDDYIKNFLGKIFNKIIFLELKPFVVSSSEIREKIKQGLDVSEFIPKEAVEVIRENGLYKLPLH